MDTSNIWNAVLAEIELKVSRPTFAAFFTKTSLNIEDKNAIISVTNPLIKEMIESRYYGEIKGLLEKHAKKNFNLVFKIGAASTVKNNRNSSPGPLFQVSKEQEAETNIRLSHLNPSFTLDNFAVSSSNQMAHAAALAVIKSPGHAYNPLFLYGGVGVGKTHLMQSVGIELLKNNRSIRVIFCTGEEFTNEIIEAIRTKTTQRFKDKFRNVNLLLIDDIQFIAGKNAVQEEFFYTFNAIQRKGSQIIFTSDRPPQEIAKLEERLRSRFEGGLLIDIQQPDFELRTAIVLIKSKQRGVDMPMNLAQELAVRVSDARRLEGSLIRLLSETQVRQEPLSIGLIQKLFGKNNLQPQNNQPATISHYISAISSYFHLKSSQLKSATRTKSIALPRQILMYLLRNELRLSLNEIGYVLGGRDHSTILHGIDKISRLRETDSQIKNDLTTIKTTLGKYTK